MSTETKPKNGNGLTATRPPVGNAVISAMDSDKFTQMQRVALAMASSTFLPEHLCFTGTKGNKQPIDPKRIAANCLRIVNQADRWGIDPFAMVDETYVVSGKLGYQGKLVAAIVNKRAGLKNRLRYEFTGEKTNRTVTVSGTFEGEDEPRTIELSVAQAKTSNQMWTSDPDQKLIYSGATKWARRHCPEIMLGVLTDEDLEVMRAQSATSTPPAAMIEDNRPATDVIADALEQQSPPPEPHSVQDQAEVDHATPDATAETPDEMAGRISIDITNADTVMLGKIEESISAGAAFLGADNCADLAAAIQESRTRIAEPTTA